MLSIELQDDKWKLVGDLNKDSSHLLWQKRKELFASSQNEITMDVSMIARTDSAGIATLIALIKESSVQNTKLKIIGATPQFHDIARVGSVEQFIHFE